MKFELVQLAAHIIFTHFHNLGVAVWKKTGPMMERWVPERFVDENYDSEVVAWGAKHWRKLRDQHKSLLLQYHPRAIPEDLLRPECRIPLPPQKHSSQSAENRGCLFEAIWSVDRPERFEITLQDETQKKDLKIILFNLPERLRKKTYLSPNNKEALKRIPYVMNINSFTAKADLLFLLTLIGLETSRLLLNAKINVFLRNYLSRYRDKRIKDDEWHALCEELIQSIVTRKLTFQSHYSFKKFIRKSMSGLCRSFKRKVAYASPDESQIFSKTKGYEIDESSIKHSMPRLYNSLRQKQEEYAPSDQSNYQIFVSPTGREIGRGIDRIAIDFGVDRYKIYRLIRNRQLSAIKVKNNLALNKGGLKQLYDILKKKRLLREAVQSRAAERDIKPASARRFFRRKHLKSSRRIEKNLPRT